MKLSTCARRVLAAAALAGGAPASCGARSPLADLAALQASGETDEEDAGQPGPVDAGEDGPPVLLDGAADAADDADAPAAAPQCLCPDDPGYAPCVLPLMCCPCAPSCEDPDTFACTCQDPHSCGAAG